VNRRHESEEETSDGLEDRYRSQIEEIIHSESKRVINEKYDPNEISRLSSLSLLKLFESEDLDLIPALMSRLGPVRAALESHGGGLLVSRGEIKVGKNKQRRLALVVGLDGACISCGAAPGTLKGIQDDLLADEEIYSVRFDSSMLEWFDEIQQDFILKFGGVTFV